ncbi:MAG: phosphonate ABC transporter ATP-binding protein [Hyphomicrobiales bacterium]|nr:MAG: phosphonate ABC transporter ATP-binding protein [Hyphomicrobiales bacterium]
MTDIVVNDLSKAFGRKQALKNVSLSVESGEMVALIGASGSGKSTLIRHMIGLEKGDTVSESTVSVGGTVVQKRGQIQSDARMVRRRVGVVFQQFNLVSRLSVLTNVLIGLLGHIPAWRGTLGWFSGDQKRSGMAALHRVGIADTALQRASTLSGGQQQRAAIARALVQKAEIVLADEPIASLDPASAKRVMETLTEINQNDGITVVVSLHQVEYARRFCPRTIAMRDGEIAYDGPSTALSDDFLRELYGEASEELVLPEGPIADAYPVVANPVPAFAGA